MKQVCAPALSEHIFVAVELPPLPRADLPGYLRYRLPERVPVLAEGASFAFLTDRGRRRAALFVDASPSAGAAGASSAPGPESTGTREPGGASSRFGATGASPGGGAAAEFGVAERSGATGGGAGVSAAAQSDSVGGAAGAVAAERSDPVGATAAHEVPDVAGGPAVAEGPDECTEGGVPGGPGRRLPAALWALGVLPRSFSGAVLVRAGQEAARLQLEDGFPSACIPVFGDERTSAETDPEVLVVRVPADPAGDVEEAGDGTGPSGPETVHARRPPRWVQRRLAFVDSAIAEEERPRGRVLRPAAAAFVLAVAAALLWGGNAAGRIRDAREHAERLETRVRVAETELAEARAEAAEGASIGTERREGREAAEIPAYSLAVLAGEALGSGGGLRRLEISGRRLRLEAISLSPLAVSEALAESALLFDAGLERVRAYDAESGVEKLTVEATVARAPEGGGDER